MSVNLSKGNKVSLTKMAETAGVQLGNIIKLGLHWDANKFASGSAIDLDAMAFKMDASKKCRSDKDFIYYGNLTGTGIKHHGDERTGESAGDDETIECDMNALLADGITAIDFVITIYDATARKQNFGMVENAGVHIYAEGGTELGSFDLSEDFSVETAVVVGQLYYNNGEWKFNPIGSGYSGTINDLCGQYGINAG